jgi:hypothetical protein
VAALHLDFTVASETLGKRMVRPSLPPSLPLPLLSVVPLLD